MLIAGSCVFAQSTTNTQSRNTQVWIDFHPHFKINENIEYYGDTGYRTIISEAKWRRFYMRPSIRYTLNSLWKVHAGVGFFYIFNEQSTNRREFTPWQGVQCNWPHLGALRVKHLVRMEERWSYRSDTNQRSFDLRVRYKLSGEFKLRKSATENNWYLPAYVELFYPINDDVEEFFRNRTRTSLGVGNKINKFWDVSLLFIWQSSRAGVTDKFQVSDFVFGIKVKKLWRVD